MTQVENKTFFQTFKSYIITCAFFIVAAITVSVVLPPKDSEVTGPSIKTVSESNSEDYLFEASLSVENISREDRGLQLYRDPNSRGAVEWFYLHITGNRDVTMAILEEAEKNDIPLSLAFALAYTESRYDAKAVNKNNRNGSIDRGLFQLNNRSFPQLKESDFFNPAVSAKYGMSHLRFCMNVAGNEVAALAMYNAGTNKVRADNTPQSTLNYVGKIKAYQEKLDKLFAEEVLSYYDSQVRQSNGIAVAFMGNRRFER